ncbi:MAG: SUMF1/EgtB/PvdO family nonheme iron enzyme [Myxococcota bacterium]
MTAPRTAYALQRHEVTWGELELAATLDGVAQLSRPSWVPRRAAARAALPATGVPWGVARAFCKSLGGDLPSEPEWEWAARGPELRPFPWGDSALDARTVHFLARGRVPVAAVGTSKQDRTPGEPGIDDLLANAQEWTRDVWTAATPDAAADPDARAVRGWPLRRPGNAIPAEGVSYRQRLCVADTCKSTADLSRVGFRCALHRASAPR